MYKSFSLLTIFGSKSEFPGTSALKSLVRSVHKDANPRPCFLVLF